MEKTEDKSKIVIVLLSCETGKGENSIAQQISRELPEATIVAPTEEVKASTQGNASVILGTYVESANNMADLKNKENQGVWRVFRGGEEIASSSSPTINYVYQDNF